MRCSYNVVTCISLAIGSQAFIGTGTLPRMAGFRRALDAEVCAVPCWRHSSALAMTLPEHSSSRRQFAKTLVGGVLGLAAALSPASLKPVVAATSQSLEDIEADLMICKEIFKPALQYLKAEQFDAARTNTNYITRFVNLKKKVDSLIVLGSDFIDDPDQLEKAFEMAQEVEALFTNFDASVYTIIFIPADANGVLPPGAEKYLKQAYGFYDDINKVLDFYIDFVPAETKKAAEKLLPEKRAALPKFLFKENAVIMKEKVAIS